MNPAAAHSEDAWLAEIRVLVMRRELAPAQALLAQALAACPASTELRRLQAGLYQQSGKLELAEQTLREVLGRDPGDAGSAFALASMLAPQARSAAVAGVLRTCFAAGPDTHDPELAINAIELLADIGRHAAASAIAEAAIAATPDDARLHAYAGMLAMQLGDFERARSRYLFALQHDPRAPEWHVAIGLASSLRYRDATHPDFGLFHDGLQRDGLSDLARAELHFALGKAHDDIGAYAEAASHFREGNAIRKRLANWSRKAWRRAIEARLAAKPPATIASAPRDNFTPIFVVGMPRSGTTLLAELLSRYPRVCNRGELPWLARLAERASLGGKPAQPALDTAAKEYARQSRQDDAGEARWFIDKQPLNFRYLDLALAMFPDARIIHCQRNPRDTALSLWMQCFLEEVQGYSYDFDDIAVVIRDCNRLMAHWGARFPGSIRTVHYEDLVSSPDSVVAGLAAWIGMPPAEASNATAPPSAISTASLWQARQPVHTNSVKRADRYLPYIPELARWTNA